MNRNKRHVHTWWDMNGKRHQDTCFCDTGKNHVTPSEYSKKQ